MSSMSDSIFTMRPARDSSALEAFKPNEYLEIQHQIHGTIYKLQFPVLKDTEFLVDKERTGRLEKEMQKELSWLRENKILQEKNEETLKGICELILRSIPAFIKGKIQILASRLPG